MRRVLIQIEVDYDDSTEPLAQVSDAILSDTLKGSIQRAVGDDLLLGTLLPIARWDAKVEFQSDPEPEENSYTGRDFLFDELRAVVDSDFVSDHDIFLALYEARKCFAESQNNLIQAIKRVRYHTGLYVNNASAFVRKYRTALSVSNERLERQFETLCKHPEIKSKGYPRQVRDALIQAHVYASDSSESGGLVRAQVHLSEMLGISHEESRRFIDRYILGT